MFQAFIGPAIGAVSSFFQSREARKAAKEGAEAKLAINAQKGRHELQMTDSDWEALSVKGQIGSLKDEYVIVIATLPIVATFVGVLVTIFNPELGEKVVAAGAKMIETLNGIDPTSTYGMMLLAAVSAALGVRLIKRR